MKKIIFRLCKILIPDIEQEWFDRGYAAAKRTINKPSKPPRPIGNCSTTGGLCREAKRWYDAHKSLRNDLECSKKKRKNKRIARTMAYHNKRKKSFEFNFCIYCGLDANTIDHMTPLSRGGKNTAENTIPACRACNLEKGNMTYDEYMTWLKYHKP